jgi:hypothetical protein
MFHLTNIVEVARDARSEANLKRLQLRDATSAALLKTHVDGATIISPAIQEVIKEEKNQGFKRQNYYYKNRNYRRNSFSGYSHGYNPSTFQLAQAIQKLSNNNQFFPNRGGDHRRIPSNPEATASLHTQKAHMEEETDVASMKNKNIRQGSAPERGGENIERGRLSILAKRWRSINGYNLVKRGIMPIYTNKPLAESYWRENLRFKEFHGTKRENKIMDQKIKEAIKNGVLIVTDKNSIR